MNGLNISPTRQQFRTASRFLNLVDETKSIVPVTGAAVMVSRLAKNIKTIKAPVTRFFESPSQIHSPIAAEYDLISVFKLLKYEPYFLKSAQKKQGLLVKSGFAISSDSDKVKEYFDSRFKYMFLQTGKSLREIIHQLAYYLIVCSNAFLVKVRDKDFEHAQSYSLDGREMHPVVGLFLAHPTSMKPRFKTVKTKKNYMLVIDKWVHFNSRGEVAEFDPKDVAHFTLYKEDGMIFGMPEVHPVIDDIRTLRKIEEDVQLLIYRDLFPIIHYTIENPVSIDHKNGETELDRARYDMEKIIQDGGIATDARHEIKFVGNEHKGIDAKPYLEYFQSRVFTGLGVSMADMGMGQDISGSTASSMSKQLTDAVRYVQQELAQQFNEMVLTEMALQSPFGIDIMRDEEIPTLEFNETDIEWKIRQENHEADLFTKNVITIDEARYKLGKNELSDEQLKRTYQGLVGQMEIDQQTESGEHMAKVSASAAPQTVKTSTGGTKVIKGVQPSGTWNNPTSTGINKGKSAADRDPIKSAKSNSNIVKSVRDAEDGISTQDMFREAIGSILSNENKSKKKLDLIFATKAVYDSIKSDMVDSFHEGVRTAMSDMKSILTDNYKPDMHIAHNIFEKIDRLRDQIVDKLSKNHDYLNIAAARVASAEKTEKTRAYNYGYMLTCVNNNKNEFVIYSEYEDVALDSIEHIGREVTIDKKIVLSAIPPFRSNSRLKLKIKETVNV
jgi:hypothetical protein